MKKKYRLNKKKFAEFLFGVGCIIALIVEIILIIHDLPNAATTPVWQHILGGY